MSYHHLTAEERSHIYELYVQKTSVREIARQTGRDKATISRELRRNQGQRGYRAGQAERFARCRQRKCANGPRVSPEVWKAAEAKLREDWSPEHISGRFRADGTGQISTQTIYDFVLADKQEGGDLHTHLRSQKKRKKKYGSGPSKRGRIPGRVGIEERPKIVDRKVRVGDWEGDLIVGKGNRQAIVSLVDRKSRLTLLHKVSGKTEQEVSAALISRLQEVAGCVKTITFDNGLEFAGHSKVAAATEARIYFCRPYHSWERGLNEQTNGLVRQYFPKGSCFSHLTEADMHRVEEKLNSRPRKVLDYRTPDEIFARSHIRKPVALRV